MRVMGLRRGLLTVSAVVLGLAVAASSWAEGMFYREVEKDGRIYVFAVMKEFESFDKSGEVGKAVTRLGYGPGGQTVIFDSEDAINLYNFKHNLPGEVFAKPKEAPKPKEEAFFKVGVTIFADYTYQDEPKVTDADKNTINASTFEVRRAYINVTGNVSDWVSYRVTPDVSARFATTATGTGVTATTNYDGSLVFRLKYALGQVNRFIAAGTCEHKYLNLGVDYLSAKDRSSPTKAEVKASGWTIWAEPRSPSGFEALFRYDHLKPNTAATVSALADSVKSRSLGGLSYWLKVKAPLAAAVLVDYEEVKYDPLLAKPTEKRFEIKTLFNF